MTSDDAINCSSRVLEYLDTDIVRNPNFLPIDFEHPLTYIADSRLHVYANNANGDWAIICEQVGLRITDDRVVTELFYFGPGFDLGANEFKLRYNLQIIDLSAVIEDLDSGVVSFDNIDLRGFDPKADANASQSDIGLMAWINKFRERVVHLPGCRATEEELRTPLRTGLTKLMTLNEWHQLQYLNYAGSITGTKPSTYETYQMLAKVICTGDTTLYRPTLTPNTHWSHWPDNKL